MNPVAAVAAGILVSVPAVALPLAAGGILVALPDVAVGVVLAVSAVLLLRPGHLRASVALALASVIWTLVGLASLFPPAVETAVSRCALLPHALLVVALTSIGPVLTGHALGRTSVGRGRMRSAISVATSSSRSPLPPGSGCSPVLFSCWDWLLRASVRSGCGWRALGLNASWLRWR